MPKLPIVLIIGEPVAVASLQARLADVLPLDTVAYSSFTGVDVPMTVSWLPIDTVQCYAPDLLRLLANFRKALIRCLPASVCVDSGIDTPVQVVMLE